MTPDPQILSRTDDGVATITFNRPDKLNALTPVMLEALFDAVGQLAADPAPRGIVVSGPGPGLLTKQNGQTQHRYDFVAPSGNFAAKGARRGTKSYPIQVCRPLFLRGRHSSK